MMYEVVTRSPSQTENLCSTEGDLSRRPASGVLARECYLDLISPRPAELVSMNTVPPNAPPVPEQGAQAQGYEYVLEVSGTGLVQQYLAPECNRPASRVNLLTIVAP
jgi:hypothetical protein